MQNNPTHPKSNHEETEISLKVVCQRISLIHHVLFRTKDGRLPEGIRNGLVLNLEDCMTDLENCKAEKEVAA